MSLLGLFGLVDLVCQLDFFWLFYCAQKDFQMEVLSKMNIQMNCWAKVISNESMDSVDSKVI